MGSKERAAYAVLAIAGFAIVGYVGQGYLRKPPNISIQAPTKGASAAQKSDTQSPAAEVVVHVIGKVKAPGVVHLPADSRVEDAVAKAGGATADADLSRLNLAARLVDGTQVCVPGKSGGPPSEPSIDPAYQGGTGAAGPSTESQPSSHRGPKATPAPHSVSLNASDATALQALPGVGPATAEHIIEYRKSHGKFATIDELMAVKGIGPKKLEKMRPYLRL